MLLLHSGKSEIVESSHGNTRGNSFMFKNIQFSVADGRKVMHKCFFRFAAFDRKYVVYKVSRTLATKDVFKVQPCYFTMLKFN